MMAEKPAPVEVFGVRSDGELIPLTSGSAPPGESGSAQTRVRVDAGRVWNVEQIGERASLGAIADTAAGRSAYQGRRAQLPGGTGDRRTRGGGREDVVAPVHVLPGVASRALHSGDLFHEPLPGVAVDVASLEVGSSGSSWTVTVTCGRLARRTRRATLRAYPSRSANLTVLELVPRRSRLIPTRSFIRAGVPAIATLCSRISRAAEVRPGPTDRRQPSVAVAR